MPDKMNLILLIKKSNKGTFFSKCIIEFLESGPRSTICGKKSTVSEKEIFLTLECQLFKREHIFLQK